MVQFSSVKVFSDDVSIYAKVSKQEDCLKLQDDLSHIYNWSLRWQLNLNPQKCEAINITNKKIPVPFTYSIGMQPICWITKIKYLGVVINSKLNWSDHWQKVVQKASVSLNRLHRAMYGCTDYAKSLAYKALVRPCLEYGSTVWSPHTAKNIKFLESVQRRAARWIKSKYDSTLYQWSKSTDDCLTELKWPTLASRRLYQSVVMLHSIMNNRTPILISAIILLLIPMLLDLIPWLYKLALRWSMHLDTPFLWTHRLYGTQYHMKSCQRHWILLDYVYDTIY